MNKGDEAGLEFWILGRRRRTREREQARRAREKEKRKTDRETNEQPDRKKPESTSREPHKHTILAKNKPTCNRKISKHKNKTSRI